jgi:hypothetical protein
VESAAAHDSFGQRVASHQLRSMVRGIASGNRPTGLEERAIRDEIETVAARYRVWSLKEDRQRLARLRRQLLPYLQSRS